MQPRTGRAKALRGLDGDISSIYGNSYQRRKRKMVDKASLWLDQPFLGFIYHNLEDLLLDQSLGEETPLDLDVSVLKASCGGPAEDPTLGWFTG